MRYDSASPIGAAMQAKSFLERCTPRQRELGLAPDYEVPVPMRTARGGVDLDTFYLTVPIGLGAGDTFKVPMRHGMQHTITVPPGMSTGGLLTIRQTGLVDV